MPIHNKEISRIFEETADLLDINGANEFRVRAYRNAARTVESLPKQASALVNEGADLSVYDGIGDSLAEKIVEIVETGTLTQLRELKDDLPHGLLELLEVPGLGPQRTGQLYKELGVDSLEALEGAIESGKLLQVEGFGEKLSETIGRRLHEVKDRQGEEKIMLAEAEEIAAGLLAYLREESSIERIEIAGSYRRRKERVGDIDLLVIGSKPEQIMKRFVDYDLVSEVVSRGETRSSVILGGGCQVDLRILEPESYGSALVYFTGSKEHNIALRSRAQERGYKVSEYGVYLGEERKAGKNEADVYGILGLPWIPPEIRENRGELEAAAENALPSLVEIGDIRGDLHTHTDWSDGSASLREMANAAREMDYEYLAITDHSPGLAVANGLSEKRLEQQIRTIEELNKEFDDFQLLSAMEVNINLDGSLDLSRELLDRLDLVVCSIHSELDRDRDTQTERLLRAMENPNCTIIGHPTGRRIGSRKGYELDMPKLIEAAKKRGVSFEINAQPERLDLTDTLARTVVDAGGTIAISTDAHSPANLRYMRNGVDQARRAWCSTKAVINTRGLADLKKSLQR